MNTSKWSSKARTLADLEADVKEAAAIMDAATRALEERKTAAMVKAVNVRKEETGNVKALKGLLFERGFEAVNIPAKTEADGGRWVERFRNKTGWTVAIRLERHPSGVRMHAGEYFLGEEKAPAFRRPLTDASAARRILADAFELLDGYVRAACK